MGHLGLPISGGHVTISNANGRKQSDPRSNVLRVAFEWCPQCLNFEPSLDALSLRSDVISSITILSLFQCHAGGLHITLETQVECLQ